MSVVLQAAALFLESCVSAGLCSWRPRLPVRTATESREMRRGKAEAQKQSVVVITAATRCGTCGDRRRGNSGREGGGGVEQDERGEVLRLRAGFVEEYDGEAGRGQGQEVRRGAIDAVSRVVLVAGLFCGVLWCAVFTELGFAGVLAIVPCLPSRECHDSCSVRSTG